MGQEVGLRKLLLAALAVFSLVLAGGSVPTAAQNSKPNIVMLMTDDTGWNDFGAYSGGVQRLVIRRQILTRWRRKALSLPAGTARQAARPDAPRS